MNQTEQKEQTPEKVTIVKMSVEDIQEVQIIERTENLSPWTFEGYKSEIENSDSLCLVAKLKDEIVGFLISRLIMYENCIEIYNIAVKDNYKRRNIASQLFNELDKLLQINNLKEIWLDVRKSNNPAISFYRKQGFEEEYTRKNFYSNPIEDGIVMVKRVN